MSLLGIMRDRYTHLKIVNRMPEGPRDTQSLARLYCAGLPASVSISVGFAGA